METVAKPVDHEDIRKETTTYGPGRSQTADVVSPPFGVLAQVVLVHGGAFVTGDKSRLKSFAAALAKRGFRVVVPNYRLAKVSTAMFTHTFAFVAIFGLCFVLCTLDGPRRGMAAAGAAGLLFVLFTVIVVYHCCVPDASVTDQVWDVAKCVHWAARTNSAPLFLAGHSAGGLLATVAVARPRYGCQHVVRGVIGISGVYSQYRLADVYCGRLVLDWVFQGDERIQHELFPINDVCGDLPAHLLLNADNDHTLKQHTLDFAATLREKGVRVGTKVLLALNHFNIVDVVPSEENEAVVCISQFVSMVLSHSLSRKTDG